jgi:spore germination protein KA
MGWIKRIKEKVRAGCRDSGLAGDHLDLSQREKQVAGIRIGPDLEKNIKTITMALGNSEDLKTHRLFIGPGKAAAALIFIDGMVEGAQMANLMQNIQVDFLLTAINPADQGSALDTVARRLVGVIPLKTADTLEALINDFTRGDTALLLEGEPRALLCDTRSRLTRLPVEPDAETGIRGPRDGFVENIRANTALLRRRLHTANFWIEGLEVGGLTRTRVAIAYIKGLADEKIIGEVRSRLQGIQIDGVLESGYLEDYLHDVPWTPYPLVLRTERPDRTAGALLEGRVAILTDGTPFVLIVPTQFSMMLQGPDDYYEHPFVGSFIRVLRLLAFLISVFLPGFYVATINFHPELLPTTLFLRVSAAREGVPFPVYMEAFMMEGLFEILREAGVRLPRAIGPAISIVGALVLGDAAIRAGLVSPPMVIVVALTAIASFSAPTFSIALAARLTRFLFILVCAVFGLFGLQFGLLLFLLHLSALRSFGLPYMYPYGPLVLSDMRDNLLRLFWWMQNRRPKLVGSREPGRQRPGPRPGRRQGPRGEREE